MCWCPGSEVGLRIRTRNKFPGGSAAAGQETRQGKRHRWQLEISPECWVGSWAQSMHSVNTCWFPASNDTEMKYKGRIKYIKILIRHTAWFSLRLSWFLLCPGHVGSVLIFMASVSLMHCHFHLLHVCPYWPFPFLTHFRPNRMLRTNMWMRILLPPIEFVEVLHH